MPEMRLAVCLPNVADVAGIAARLRGAAVRHGDDLTRLGGCDALMVSGLGGPAALEVVLRSGVHVLAVADPGLPLEAIVSLTATARAAGVQLAVVNPDRYLPSRQLIHQQLAGPLGEPGLIRLHRWEPSTASPPRVSDLPARLLNDIDVALWFYGRQPDRVFAVARGADRESVQVHLGFPGGGMALLDFDGRLPPGDGYQSLSVIAAAGAAHADDHPNTHLRYRGGSPRAVRAGERAGQYAAVAQDFVNALQAGRDLTDGASAWRTVFAVAAAVNRSLESGQAVSPEGR